MRSVRVKFENAKYKVRLFSGRRLVKSYMEFDSYLKVGFVVGQWLEHGYLTDDRGSSAEMVDRSGNLPVRR